MSTQGAHPLWLSLEVSAAATALATLGGVALAGLLARSRSRWADVLEALVTAPMVLPPTVLGYYLLRAVGRSSSLGRAFEALTGAPLAFSKTAAVLAGTIAALPLVVRTARAALEAVDVRYAQAAATLGAAPLEVFLTVSLPLARRGVLAGVTLGFARALGDFGVTLLVAGNIPGLTRTAPLAIYDAVAAQRDDEAASLAAALTGLGVAALLAATVLSRRTETRDET